jgi:NAD(P)-dependent dehydrogenase (short-subunit alcohol dehydrogenase family)
MRNTAKAGPLRAGAEAAGVSVEVLQLDVNDSKSISAAIEEVIGREGRIDVLVNNAGVTTRGPIEDYDDDEVLAIFDTNVFGVIRVTRAVLPHMRSQGSGAIVTVSSLGGRVPTPFSGIYSASKHAVEAVSDALHYELHQFGIRAVLIEPDEFDTQVFNNLLRARRFSEGSAYLEAGRRFAEARERLTDPGRRGDPQVVADVIVDAAKADQPKRRYLVGRQAEVIGGMHKTMSDEEFEKAMRTMLNWQD